MNKERLLNVAKALRESPNPEQFSMGTEVHGCGAPACAWGHYAARRDLQDVAKIERRPGTDVFDTAPSYCSDVVIEHFDISWDEWSQLFSAAEGCGRANTALEAAEFIERFVAESA